MTELAKSRADFQQAVESLRVGVNDDAAVLIRRIRTNHGPEVAEQAKKELIAFARSGRNLKA